MIAATALLAARADPGAAPSSPMAEFELDGRPCQLICVDDVLPRHSAPKHGARPRLSYAEAEIAHFEWGGHTYALVESAQAAQASPGAPSTHDAAEPPQDIRALLTNRELQIVQLICMGCLTKQVADRLRISEFTVRSYLKAIYCKLGVRSRGAMVYRYAQAIAHPRGADAGPLGLTPSPPRGGAASGPA